MASRILLADDSITIQKVVNLTFADEGIDVVTVSNGEMAQRRLTEINPDLVLADIFMPGKNGYELCQYIKESPQFRTVPVVLLVGAFEPFDQAEARRVNADGHLTKPFESRTLVETVRKLIQERKSASGQLRYIQQAQTVSSVPETRPLTTQPLEAPFNIDLSPIEEAGLSSGFSFGSSEPAQHESGNGLPQISPFDEPFRLDYGTAWHTDAPAEPNGGNGHAAGKSERVTADLTPPVAPPDTLGFDFTQVDQPEPPLSADTLSVDLFTTEQTAPPPPSSLPDFSASLKAEDELLSMELSQVKTGPLDAAAVAPVDWNAAPVEIKPVHDLAPVAPSVTPAAVSDSAPTHSFLGEDEPLGDLLSEDSGKEAASAPAPAPEAGTYESALWSASPAPTPPAEDISFDFSSPGGGARVPDSGEVSNRPVQVPLSNLGPGDFLIGSEDVRGGSAASLDFADMIASTNNEEHASMAFQPLSLETQGAVQHSARPADSLAEAHDNVAEEAALRNISEFRASEMWAQDAHSAQEVHSAHETPSAQEAQFAQETKLTPQEAPFAPEELQWAPIEQSTREEARPSPEGTQWAPVEGQWGRQAAEWTPQGSQWAPEETHFSAIDIEAVPVQEEPTAAALVPEHAGESSQFSIPIPIEITPTQQASEPIGVTSAAHISEPIDLTSESGPESTGATLAVNVSEPIDLMSDVHVSEPLVDLGSTPHFSDAGAQTAEAHLDAPISEPIEFTSAPAQASETTFDFAVPAPQKALPEIGFDIVQPTVEAVVAQPDISHSPQEESAAVRASDPDVSSPEPSVVQQEAKAAAADGPQAGLQAQGVEEIVRRVLQEMTDSVVREIAWEVVPDCVERVVAATVERLARESMAKRGQA